MRLGGRVIGCAASNVARGMIMLLRSPISTALVMFMLLGCSVTKKMLDMVEVIRPW